jgi:hypothetical protein
MARDHLVAAKLNDSEMLRLREIERVTGRTRTARTRAVARQSGHAQPGGGVRQRRAYPSV